MKRLFTVLAILLLAAAWLPAVAQVSSSTRVPSHPRLIMPKGEEKNVLARAQTDATWRRCNMTLVSEARTIAEQEPKEYPKNLSNMLNVSRDYLRRLFIVSYAYRVTGEQVFASCARDLMLTATNFPDWHPQHFLDVAEMTTALAIGYDWCYDALSKRERKDVGEAVINMALKPSLDEQYNNSFLKQNSNWNQVCNGALTLGALAVWEADRKLCSQIVNRSVENIGCSMRSYAPDGVYPEGLMYWQYGTTFNVMMIEALTEVFGSDFGLCDYEGFLRTGDYASQMLSPALNPFSYADFSRGEPMIAPVAFWFAERNGDPSEVYGQLGLIKQKGISSVSNSRFAPLILIWGAGIDTANPVEPKQLFWHGAGTTELAVMRTAWSAPSAAWLAVKLGTANVAHGHLDVGSFVYERDGVLWAADLGGEDYNVLSKHKVNQWSYRRQSQRWDVFRYSASSHNLVTFGDLRPDAEAKAKLVSSEGAGFPMSVTADLGEVYTSQVAGYKRTAALEADGTAIISDHITTASATTMTWSIVTPAVAEKTADGNVRLTSGDKSLILRVEAPAKVTCDIAPATPATDYENKNRGYSVVRFTMKLPPQRSIDFKVSLVKE